MLEDVERLIIEKHSQIPHSLKQARITEEWTAVTLAKGFS